MKSDSIHQFTVQDLEGNTVPLKRFEGKVLLVVNTATQCGLAPQLEGMEDLYEEFRDQGLEILAFPSDDFANQEPLEGLDIKNHCALNYGAKYPIFDKVHVTGNKACELFKFLGDKNQNGAVSSKPKWNFHKYLVDKDGKVVDYFLSLTVPTAGRVKRAIKKLL